MNKIFNEHNFIGYLFIKLTFLYLILSTALLGFDLLYRFSYNFMKVSISVNNRVIEPIIKF